MMNTRETSEIFFNDVTLRDGEQAPGNGMSPEQKLAIAMQLQKMGINGIEAGFANASPEERDSIEQISAEVGSIHVPNTEVYPRISSLARLSHDDIVAALTSVQGAPHRGVHTFISTSDIQKIKFANAIRKRGGNPESMRDLLDKIILPGIEEELGYISKTDPRAVIQFSPEDWTRTSDDVSDEVILAAAQHGAKVINLPDTVGIGIPREIFLRVQHARKVLDAYGYTDVTISWHGHNDTYQGVSCAMEALYGGARQMEPTILGIGERTGNFSFEGFIASLDANKEKHNQYAGTKLTDTIVRGEIMNTVRLVSSSIGMHIPREHPIVGENAFAHESGIHQHGDQAGKKNGINNVYEILDPETYGATSKIILGKHSGMAGLVSFFEKHGLHYDAADRAQFVEALSKAGETRRKGLSDQEVLDKVYYPVVIEVTGGSFVTEVTEIEPFNGMARVAMKLRDGQTIIGTASDTNSGVTSATINAMQQIVPDVNVAPGGLNITDTGGTDSKARVSITIKNAHEVTRVLEHGNLEQAERLALIEAFNALYAMEKYSEKDGE